MAKLLNRGRHDLLLYFPRTILRSESGGVYTHALTTLLFLLSAFAVLLTACGADTPEPRPTVTRTVTRTVTVPVQATAPSPEPAPSPTTAQPVTRASATPLPDLLIVGGMTHPDSTDWYTTRRADPLSFWLGTVLHTSLLNSADSLADEWGVSGSRITFRLNRDGAWSDGTPVRGADIVDILQQAVASGEIDGVLRMSADGQTITITTQGDVCPTLMRIGAFPIVDVREFPPVRTSRNVIVRAIGEAEWDFTVPDNERSFTYRYFDDENDLREAWAAGEITAVAGASRLKLGPLPGATRAVAYPSNLLAALIFQLGDATIQSQAVRDALALATDRAALYEQAYGVTVPRLPSTLLYTEHWASPDFELPYSAGAAVELLEEAGWSDRDGDGVRENEAGEPLAVTLMASLSADEQWEAVGRSLVEQWRAIGVDAAIQFVESYPLEERLHDGRWQVAMVAYQMDSDPDQRALWTPPAPDDLVGQDLNVTGYDNPRVTDLLNRAARVSDCDLTERATLYHRAWEQIKRDKPLYPLFPLPLDIVVK